MGHFTKALQSLQKDDSEKEPVSYWLGTPCQYDENRKELEGLPEGDLGGRVFRLPPGMTPGSFFDEIAPLLGMVSRHALQQQARNGLPSSHNPLPAHGVLAQAVQMGWVFASREISVLREELAQVRAEMDELKKQCHAP